MFLLGGVRVSSGYRQSQTTTYNYTYIFGFPYVDTEKNDLRTGYVASPYIGAAWTLIPDLLSLSARYQHSFAGTIRSYLDGALVNELTDNGSDYIAIDLRILWF